MNEWKKLFSPVDAKNAILTTYQESEIDRFHTALLEIAHELEKEDTDDLRVKRVRTLAEEIKAIKQHSQETLEKAFQIKQVDNSSLQRIHDATKFIRNDLRKSWIVQNSLTISEYVFDDATRTIERAIVHLESLHSNLSQTLQKSPLERVKEKFAKFFTFKKK